MLPSAKLVVSLSPPAVTIAAKGLLPALGVVGIGAFVAWKFVGAIAESISSAEDRGADFLTTTPLPRIDRRHELVESRGMGRVLRRSL